MRQVILLAVVALICGVATVHFIENAPQQQRRVQPETVAAPSRPVPAGGRIVTIARDGSGHFQVNARVDGRPIEFMVDTGASAIALRESSAARLGIRPMPRDYTIRLSTANGTAMGAPVTLNSVDIDGVVVRDVRAVVQPDEALPVNLLGMSYLGRVRFSHERGRLVIEQ